MSSDGNAHVENKREKRVAEAVHSGEMEGLTVTLAARADAEEYIAGYMTPMISSPAPAAAMGPINFIDPCLDPESGILCNKVGARTQAALDEAEGDLTFARLIQLMDCPPKATGDLAELRAIHRYLFQDIYQWAGELRTVDVRKSIGKGEPFLPVSMIGHAIAHITEELRLDHDLRDMRRDRFIERLAHHYNQLNYVHPFQEGYGRVQRVFWNRIARDAGCQLDWREVHGETNDRACRIASDLRDLNPLQEMFDQIVTAAPLPKARDKAWRWDPPARITFPVKNDPGS